MWVLLGSNQRPPDSPSKSFLKGVDYLITLPPSCLDRSGVPGTLGEVIGWIPHSLVSAPFLLLLYPFAGLGSGLP